MLALATMREARMRISTVEIEAPARPYTVETMANLQAQFAESDLFFVMGTDSFRDVTMWRSYETLLTHYSTVVAARPGYLAEQSDANVLGTHLPPALQSQIVDLRGSRLPSAEHLEAPHIFVTDYVAEDVSATAIRTAVEANEGIENLVPTVVADYVRKYSLYTA
jgi:nicotinate-nucleotide adenylyltransferase